MNLDTIMRGGEGARHKELHTIPPKQNETSRTGKSAETKWISGCQGLVGEKNCEIRFLSGAIKMFWN